MTYREPAAPAPIVRRLEVACDAWTLIVAPILHGLLTVAMLGTALLVLTLHDRVAVVTVTAAIAWLLLVTVGLHHASSDPALVRAGAH